MSNTILLTGVSRGLGQAICHLLLENGYTIIGVSRKKNNFVEEMEAEYKNHFSYIEFDLNRTNDIENVLYKNVIGTNTCINGFINNAAIAYDDIISNMRIEPLEKMFRINVFTPMLIVKSVIRNMLLHNSPGSIIHISSISVHTGYKGLSMYAATKGALEAFSKNMAREWGEKNIRSNCIVAGFMETEMSRNLTNEQKDRIFKRTSLKQPTELQCVAETVLFLLSEKSGSITGQNIHVDNGTI